MFNNYFKTGFISFTMILTFIIICICIYTPILYLNPSISLIASTPKFYPTTKNFAWPVPSCTYISSYFGYRQRPTTGASTYHSGIDIPGKVDSDIVAIVNGTIKFVGFNGGTGCTVILENENFTFIYGHVSPNYLVKTGDIVSIGQVIARIGPKNVYGIPNNYYKDSNGNPTNGATTGPHLHLTIKKDGKAVNPLDYISSS